MLITRTPLRVSFFGGGSDLPAFYNVKDGLCVSTTIDSFIYLVVHPCVASHLRVIYSELEQVTDVNDIQHDRVRESLKFFEMTNNIEICSFSNVPVKGTGLGSSSTFTVGLVKALYQMKYGFPARGRDLADLAAFVELSLCGQPIGKQDQYAAACGGFKSYRFTPDHVFVRPVVMDPNTKFELESHLLFFNTGISRQASSIIKAWKPKENFDIISSLVDMAEQSLKFLEEGRVMDFGHLLHCAWSLKRIQKGVTNDHIDEMYDTAMKAGAVGGKLLGAGGGGYLMVFVAPERRENVLKAMAKYERRNFRFYNGASEICNLDFK